MTTTTNIINKAVFMNRLFMNRFNLGTIKRNNGRILQFKVD